MKLRQCEREVLQKAIDHITLQKLRVEDLAEDALYYTPEETDKSAPEPPLASEENSDVTSTNESRNSGEYDLDVNSEPEEQDLGNGENTCGSSVKSDTESTLTNASELSQVTNDDTGQSLDQNHNPDNKRKDLPTKAEPLSAEDDIVESKVDKTKCNGVNSANTVEE